MKTSTKAGLYVFLIFLVIYLIVRFILQIIFSDINIYLLSAISAAITVVLSPQRRIIKKQSGEEIQLKWLFSKKVIILK
ncbi:hypothetical protein [Winogradskyella luteola]|uniref:Uncharacterized protein n=1 Tax=Winogradskyella luteola TaxID=2828330 RepID=A0A9X1JPW6_9FLAO|nr:hypothetical protein [Winogradskyella luteola]MBV7269124.1 hypothetical protein [Winogradskyella luteola]